MIKKLIDLLLYSNLWIALCATAMAFQTQLTLSGHLEPSPLIGLIFFSTLFLYALHRIVGLSKVTEFLDMERFATIASFKNHIIVYAVLAAIGGLYCFLHISWTIRGLLFVPGLISLAYVLPIFGKKRRLRDFNQIKIYLIALVWAWITVVLVALDDSFYSLIRGLDDVQLWGMFIERACFIFAITLPFDIRDLHVDAKNDVATIPARIGAAKSKRLAYILLTISFLIANFFFLLGVYNTAIFFGSGLGYFLTAILISFSDKTQQDYFFTGLVDGTMLLLFGLIWLGVLFF